MSDEDFTRGEKLIIRNQRLIMLGLISLLSGVESAPGRGYHLTNLRERVNDLDRNLEWVAPPSQRL